MFLAQGHCIITWSQRSKPEVNRPRLFKHKSIGHDVFKRISWTVIAVKCFNSFIAIVVIVHVDAPDEVPTKYIISYPPSNPVTHLSFCTVCINHPIVWSFYRCVQYICLDGGRSSPVKLWYFCEVYFSQTGKLLLNVSITTNLLWLLVVSVCPPSF